MYTTKELRMMFAGCETAQNIIREQIGDVDGRAVWYPWDTERIRPVTPEQIIKEVQDAWDALPLSRSVEACELVDPDELAHCSGSRRREGTNFGCSIAQIVLSMKRTKKEKINFKLTFCVY